MKRTSCKSLLKRIAFWVQIISRQTDSLAWVLSVQDQLVVADVWQLYMSCSVCMSQCCICLIGMLDCINVHVQRSGYVVVSGQVAEFVNTSKFLIRMYLDLAK